MPTKNENGITLSPGAVYINGEAFGGVSEVTCTRESNDTPELTYDMIQHVIETFTGTVNIPADPYMRFVQYITGITAHMKATCPNRKVVHLAYHAKKMRVRKKNYRRMIRICEKYDRSIWLYAEIRNHDN